VSLHALEVTDFEQIDQLAATMESVPIDLLINNAGVFGPKVSTDEDYRQQFGHMDYDIWMDILRINTFAPLKMAEAFVENVAMSEQKKMAVISSFIGSSEDAQGSFYAYGSSKAAVSKVFANLAKDLSVRGIAVGVYCPGWVPTELGGSQGTVPVEQSIGGLRLRFDELTLESAGAFTRYNGDALNW
jgi:NAD(P)-dependent dehydrogenase (short-subunit alcohol dehydrogenase family)